MYTPKEWWQCLVNIVLNVIKTVSDIFVLYLKSNVKPILSSISFQEYGQMRLNLIGWQYYYKLISYGRVWTPARLYSVLNGFNYDMRTCAHFSYTWILTNIFLCYINASAENWLETYKGIGLKYCFFFLMRFFGMKSILQRPTRIACLFFFLFWRSVFASFACLLFYIIKLW